MIRLSKKLAVFFIILVGILLLGGIATAGYFAFTYREPINNYYKEGYNKISEYNTEIKKISQNIFQNNLVKTLSEVEKSLNEGRKLTQNNSFASGLDSSLNALEGSLKKINNFDSNAAFTQIKHTLNNITSFVDQMLEKFPNPNQNDDFKRYLTEVSQILFYTGISIIGAFFVSGFLLILFTKKVYGVRVSRFNPQRLLKKHLVLLLRDEEVYDAVFGN